MHPAAYQFVLAAIPLAGLHPASRVLEIGARDVNGSVRPLFGPCTYVGLDIAPGPGVGVIADAGSWDPVADIGYRGPVVFDTVVCCEVLEHADNARAIVRNAFRLLTDGGLFIMTCAGDGRGPHSAVDGGPLRPGEFYHNVGTREFEEWAAPFSKTLMDTAGPDLRALCIK